MNKELRKYKLLTIKPFLITSEEAKASNFEDGNWFSIYGILKSGKGIQIANCPTLEIAELVKQSLEINRDSFCIWNTEDIELMAKQEEVELSLDQVHEIAEKCQSKFNAEAGFNWDDIREEVEKYKQPHIRTVSNNGVSRLVECGSCHKEFMYLEDDNHVMCPTCNHYAEIEDIKTDE